MTKYQGHQFPAIRREPQAPDLDRMGKVHVATRSSSREVKQLDAELQVRMAETRAIGYVTVAGHRNATGVHVSALHCQDQALNYAAELVERQTNPTVRHYMEGAFVQMANGLNADLGAITAAGTGLLGKVVKSAFREEDES